MVDFKIKTHACQFLKENMNELKELPKEQRQKIANFWKEDVDDEVSSPIEEAILKGFTSKSGNILMSKVDEFTFNRRDTYCDGSHADVYNSKYGEISVHTHLDGRKDFCIFHRYKNSDTIIRSDELIDYDGDGFADARKICLQGFSTFGTQNYYDNDLDGHFEESDRKIEQKFIDEMLSDNDNQ